MASGSSGVKADAISSYGTNTGEATSAYNTLSPIYTQMATNPQGFTPQQKANMLTASAQSLGGGVAAATGEGNLEAARTGNIGGYDVALDDAARNVARVQSGNALQVQNEDAQLADEHQREGLAGLNSIYGTSTDAGLGYLKTAEAAPPSFWQHLGTNAADDALAVATSYGMKKPAGGCWIAMAIYGDDDTRTHTVRAYLNGPFRASLRGELIMRAYLRHGERIASRVRKSAMLRAVLRPLFDRALSNALALADKEASRQPGTLLSMSALSLRGAEMAA